MVKSKNGWTTTSSKSNFFNTKTESKSTHKFSFILCNTSSDSALVNAAENIEAKAVQGFKLFENFTLGEDELSLDAHNFSATITINRDTTDTWILIMNTEINSNSENTGKAILISKEREIIIVSASSNKFGTDKRTFPAMGYEFIENDLTVSAVQYYAGGALGMNKNIVWINNVLEPKMKLILAAAITAIMQLKSENMTSY